MLQHKNFLALLLYTYTKDEFRIDDQDEVVFPALRNCFFFLF